jgi:hypothetical protein
MNPEALILFSPYLLLPLFTRLVFRRVQLRYKVIPYLITGSILFIYPIVFIFVKEQNPSSEEIHCGNMDFGILLGCIIFFLPISLGLQALFNYLIKDKIKK